MLQTATVPSGRGTPEPRPGTACGVHGINRSQQQGNVDYTVKPTRQWPECTILVIMIVLL